MNVADVLKGVANTFMAFVLARLVLRDLVRQVPYSAMVGVAVAGAAAGHALAVRRRGAASRSQ